ncbi:peroxiredoxin [Limnochorda pilosa]|uniref:Peroxiredoxin n=1 Tax=Limnochorda pilosa TaxID=1555112 RepID=A0A0K2SHM2_LIMPI|nr:peroxiredoxin [Limnochorda pilosa]BAS26590.1 peroxiredoxin [Limnochorda pilosa]
MNVGDRAPDFTLKATGPDQVSLSDYRGKNVVLLFFPLAFSPVCTEELCGVRDGLSEFKGLKADVLAISVDSPYTLKAFAQAENLPFPLLSDFNKEVAPRYGAYYEDLAGLKGVAKRAAFVVDGDGIVRYRWVSDVATRLPDMGAIKSALAALA